MSSRITRLVSAAALAAAVAAIVWFLPQESYECTLPFGGYALTVTRHPILPIMEAELDALPGVELPPGTPRHVIASSDDELGKLAATLVPIGAVVHRQEFRSLEFWRRHCPNPAGG